jgi:predicted transcriptional regulator
MKKHNGMRPHDVVILLKIIAIDNENWMMKDIANKLHISSSEVSESLNRSVWAGLMTNDKRRVFKSALLDFITHGLKYVYPQKPGAMVRGIKTAHSAPPLSFEIQSEQNYVWPYAEGDSRGFAIEPLHLNVPKACLEDTKLHELLALLDAVRIGNTREQNMAINELKKRIQ